MKRTLVLHNDVREVPELTAWVDSIAEAGSLLPGLVMSLNLALEEAVTNVMLYAYPDGQEGLVEIAAVLEPGKLTFVVTDSGIPFDPTAAPEADTTLGVEERPIGGLGIFLVRTIMDIVTYERRDGKNILTLQKYV